MANRLGCVQALRAKHSFHTVDPSHCLSATHNCAAFTIPSSWISTKGSFPANTTLPSCSLPYLYLCFPAEASQLRIETLGCPPGVMQLSNKPRGGSWTCAHEHRTRRHPEYDRQCYICTGLKKKSDPDWLKQARGSTAIPKLPVLITYV